MKTSALNKVISILEGHIHPTMALNVAHAPLTVPIGCASGKMSKADTSGQTLND